MASTLYELRQEYERTYAALKIDLDRRGPITKTVRRLVAARDQYQLAAVATGIPWGVIAVLHARKNNGDFKTHLHNSDPLTARTRSFPANRPRTGSAPFAWHLSAADALRLKGIDDIASCGEWGIAEACFAIEKWNGFGFRHLGLPSGFLWAGSSAYQRGWYGPDGHFDRTAVDPHAGGMVLLKFLLELAPDALGAASKTVSTPRKQGFSFMTHLQSNASLTGAAALVVSTFALSGVFLAMTLTVPVAPKVVVAALVSSIPAPTPIAALPPVIAVAPIPEPALAMAPPVLLETVAATLAPTPIKRQRVVRSVKPATATKDGTVADLIHGSFGGH